MNILVAFGMSENVGKYDSFVCINIYSEAAHARKYAQKESTDKQAYLYLEI